MRRYRSPLFFLGFGAFALLPLLAAAAGADFSGPIISGQAQTCPAGWGAVIQTIANLVQFAIYLGVTICVLMMAYAGFLWVLNPTNPENRSTGRKVLINAAIGLVLTLSAWLIVNTLLTVLGVGGIAGTTGILGNGATCITANPSAGGGLGNAPSTPGGGGGAGGPVADHAPNTRGDCTPSGLQQNGMDSSITTKMSCVTKYEDASCSLGQKSGTDIGADGNSVSFGMFQVNISANNLDQYPACKAAVGNASLNCTSAFTGGAYTASNHNTQVSNQRLYSTCVQAVSNPQCNTQVAEDLYKNHGGIGNWGYAAQNGCG